MEENQEKNGFTKALEERNLGIYKALAAFQQDCPVIHKGAQGHNYSYADLPAIFEVINPLLSKHGLGFTQPLNGNSIRTVLFHIETGETIESVTDIPVDTGSRMNLFQSAGSGITYFRRYAISSLLGIVTDKDVDAATPPKPKTVVKKVVEVRKSVMDDTLLDGYLAAFSNGTHKISKAELEKTYTMSPEQLKRLKAQQ